MTAIKLRIQPCANQQMIMHTPRAMAVQPPTINSSPLCSLIALPILGISQMFLYPRICHVTSEYRSNRHAIHTRGTLSFLPKTTTGQRTSFFIRSFGGHNGSRFRSLGHSRIRHKTQMLLVCLLCRKLVVVVLIHPIHAQLSTCSSSF